jgi:hypothetical protein
MKKPAPRRDKYFLRDLHREIDLYDRKLAYIGKFAEFASPLDREEAEKSLLAKRLPLRRLLWNSQHLALNMRRKIFHDLSTR